MKGFLKYGFITIPVAFFLFVILFNTDEDMKANFYSSVINGTLKYVRPNKGASIVVNNVTYQIYPLDMYIVNGRRQFFIDIAKSGDSISKQSNSYVFTLYKKDKKYSFTGY